MNKLVITSYDGRYRPVNPSHLNPMARLVTSEDRKDLKRRFIQGIQRVLAGDPGNTVTGQSVPDFLAGPSPSDSLGAFQHRSGRAICDRWARGARPQILPGREAYYRQLCTPYLGSGLPGNPSTTFQDGTGQCVTRYDFTWTVNGNPESNQSNFQWIGPMTKPVKVPGFTAWFEFQNGNGNTFRAGSQFSTNNGAFTGWLRVDGQPDNCAPSGDFFEPGTRNPTADPKPGPVGGPTGFGFPSLDITIGPEGEIIIDFGDDSPDETIDPNNETTTPTGPDPGNIGDPADPIDTGLGDEAEDEAPENSVIGALKINVLSSPPTSRQFSPGIFRGACYVYLGTSDGLDHDPAGAMLVDGQLVLPEKDNLTHWKVTANSGYNLRVTPFYLEV